MIKIKIQLFFVALLCSVIFSGCLTTNERYEKLAPGIWRGELYLDKNNPIAGNISKIGNTKDVVTGTAFTEGVLPFNFEVTYPQPDSMVVVFINGTERIPVSDIQYGRSRKTGHDTIRINFVEYDTYIQADVEDGIMSGLWVNPRRNYSVTFRGLAGKSHRFTLLKEKPAFDISGRWSSVFNRESASDTLIGDFTQRGNTVTGTFLSPTGDYGFLDGTIQGDKMYLSSFDGQRAYLFAAHVSANDRMEGIYLSGPQYSTTWTADKKMEATLPDAATLVQATTTEPVHFAFEDEKGQLISIDDAQFHGKIKLIQVMGTWCPNCKDETAFLLEYLQKYPDDKLAILGIAFEAYSDTAKVRSLLSNYRQKLGITYPIVWGGKTGGDAKQKLPFLSDVKAYPTSFILDADNRIVSVHTGFSGPATKEYESFKQSFEKQMKELLDR